MGHVSIDDAMTILTSDMEIDNYLREMFRQKCQSAWLGYHCRIFWSLDDDIHDGIMKCNSDETKEWLERLDVLMKNSVIQQEEYDIIDGVVLLKTRMESTYNEGNLVKHLTIDKEKDHSAVTMLRIDSKYLISEVRIIEYDDYYEEMIDTRNPKSHNDTTCVKLTNKRELFREEYHTMPFRPVHNEMLYSLETPKWYMNEARRAQGHFESLSKD